MYRVTLKLYREQVRQLILFIPDPGYISKADTVNRTLEEILILEWRAKLTRLQIRTWSERDNNKKYGLSLPMSVAVAFWKDLQNYELTPELRQLLGEIDHELVDAGLKS
ncbi:hypothetical protein [Spirosoma foliorum]|uniref:Uncharacterized protein n=1 Tax=Spirosoma foliorum TaxID=2710596 RepID=A0A7G5GYV8_9BACT|nr:hypothetical protein [Spirosoma foliorum]QMW04050.1 hypothetical protein H3H32_03585 [Spirosoma foliorum]